jgi:hypothetical protein
MPLYMARAGGVKKKKNKKKTHTQKLFAIKTHTSDEDCMHKTLTLGAKKVTIVDVQSDAEKTRSPLKLLAKNMHINGTPFTFQFFSTVHQALNFGSKGLITLMTKCEVCGFVYKLSAFKLFISS